MDTSLLKAAAHVSGIWSLAAFAIAALVWYLASRKGRVPPIAWTVVTIVGLLGLVPIVGSFYVQVVTDRSLYVLRVNVVDTRGRPVHDAVVSDSLGNHADARAGAWQFEIPKQTRPADGQVTVYASIPNTSAHGSTKIVLGSDYSLASTVVVAFDDTARIRGTVQDAEGHAIAGARVSVEGYGGESVITDASGSFDLSAHAGDDQQVALHAEKHGYHPVTQWHPAGKFSATLILRPE